MQLRNGKVISFEKAVRGEKAVQELEPLNNNDFMNYLTCWFDEIEEWEPIGARINGLYEIYEFIRTEFSRVTGEFTEMQRAFLKKIHSEIPPIIFTLERYLVNPMYDDIKDDMKKLGKCACIVYDMIK
jgi:hypothetical protein